MPERWRDPSPHKSLFAKINGIRLNYLDWGGTGPPLILIHGIEDNPHAFDSLAPKLTSHFRVLAYARRAHGRSGARGPYDIATLVEDLCGFMDRLHIRTAHLAGYSMGGNEVTAMAATHPGRVGRIVYLDGGYDWGDPTCAAMKDPPGRWLAPASAFHSLDACRAFLLRLYPELKRARWFEAWIRDAVVVRRNGSVRRRRSDRAREGVNKALWSQTRDYTRVRAPALAIYATRFLDPHAGTRGGAGLARWESHVFGPFREASKRRLRSELRGSKIMTIRGTHSGFFTISEDQVARTMIRFLSGRMNGHTRSILPAR